MRAGAPRPRGAAAAAARTVVVAVAVTLLVFAIATTAGCFSPDTPACAFSCAEPPNSCPAGFTCGPDQLCHDPTRTGICPIQLVDGGTADSVVRDGGAGPADGGGDSTADHAP